MHMQQTDLSSVRVVVIGDLMLDRYWHGDTDRISPEAPVPVVKIGLQEDRLGGAANVALNCAMLGAQVTLLGCVGQDEAASRLEALCQEQGIKIHFVKTLLEPTITKLRVLGRVQQLIRLDFERIFSDHSEILVKHLDEVLADCDVVILSDYAKGVLQRPGVFIDKIKAAGKPVVVDPKCRDWHVYRGATLLTPNLKEFQQAIGRVVTQDAEIEEAAQHHLAAVGVEALLVTRGASGMSLMMRAHPAVHVPTEAKEVYDVTGAGDTVIAVLGTMIGARKGLGEAVSWANRAAGIVVGKVGTASVTPQELYHPAGEALPATRKILSERALLAEVAALRRQGKRVVMTNGCFDILHPGHIDYLERAKNLGDVLIVAVNEDASVSRLKGPARPIHQTRHRMQVLAGLQSVTYLVPFAEDTPRRLIAAVLPDVLCKGGDYQISEIAGAQEVLVAGGEVKILPFVEGCSTTKTIEKIQQEGAIL